MNVLSKVIRRSASKVRWAFARHETKDSMIKDRLTAEPWYIDSLSIDGAVVTAEGWSFATDTRTDFYLNDVRVDELEYPLSRTDVGEVFWQRRGASMSGFRCRSTNVENIFPDGVLKISRAIDDGRIDAGRDSWYLPDAAAHLNLPDADRRFRVIGSREAGGFLDTGATDFYRLNDVAKKVAGKDLWDQGSVLDWGVGCGRLARHFPASASGTLSGCDIDSDNVEWCCANLAGRFVRSELRPPLPFADRSFDLIYAVSVFTHLREALQNLWLAELRRVTRVGGIVLTTVHGETAMDFLGLPPAGYSQLRRDIARKGLLVVSDNAQIAGHVDTPAEYVNVFHHRDYVARRWSKYFDILHFIPGYIFTHDLVVMRRTA